MTTYFNLAEPQFRYPAGAGYKVYAYQIGGTTTPISTYSAYTGGTNAWPVVLADDGDGNGVASIFLTQDATIVIKDAADVTQPGYPKSFVVPASVESLTALDGSTDSRLDAVESDILSLQTDVGAIVVPDTLVCSVHMQNLHRITCSTGGAAILITNLNVADSGSVELWDNVNSQFLPSTEGWWRITVSLGYSFSHPGNDDLRVYAMLYKNASQFKRLWDFVVGDNEDERTMNASMDVYFNGTTDFVDIRTLSIGTAGTYYVGSTSSGINAQNCCFQATYIGPGYSAP